MQSHKRKPEVCTTYGHTLVANHDCPTCNHRVCRWCYVDERQLKLAAREQGIKPNFNGPPDLGAVRFHERRAASQKLERLESAVAGTSRPEASPEVGALRERRDNALAQRLG